MRIPAHEQRNFLRTTPALKLSLPRQRLMDVVIRLPIEQPGDVVPIGEPVKMMKLMLEYSPMQIATEPKSCKGRDVRLRREVRFSYLPLRSA